MTVSDSDLRGLGWTESFAAHLPAGTVPARVARVDRGAAEVITADGPRRVRFGARVRRAAADDPVALPCVGDWVALAPLPAADVAGGLELAKVLPRRTAIVRGGVARPSRGGPSGDSTGQVLAANVDVVFVAEPARHGPDPANLGRIERLLALAWESGGTPVVLITKADLAGDALPELLAEVARTAPGVAVHAVAARIGEGWRRCAATSAAPVRRWCSARPARASPPSSTRSPGRR